MKDTVVAGSLRATDTIYATTAQFQILKAPTTNGGTTYGPGTSGNFLKSNGTSAFWASLAAADIPSLSTDKLTSGTLPVARGGTGQTSIANIQAGKDGDGKTISSTYLKLDGSNNMTADVNIITGDTDKFVNFWYNSNKIAGASWRIGAAGTGVNDANYFLIQSGTSTASATTWNTALRIGQNTYDIGIGGNLYPISNNSKTLGTSSLKWSNVYATTFTGNLTGNVTGTLSTTRITLPGITGTGTIGADQGSSNTSTRYKPAEWTFDAGITPVDGDIITIKQPCAGHDYGTWLTVDGGSSYHPVVYNQSSRITTHFSNGQAIMLTYDSTGTASVFAHGGAMARTTATGVWRVLTTYNSDNDATGYYHRRIYPNLKAGTGGIFPYTLIMQLPNGRWSSIVTSSISSGTSPKATGKTINTNGFIPGRVLVMYSNTTYSDGSNIGTYNIWSAHTGLIDARYSFNLENSSGKGFTGYTPVYIVGTLNTSGLFVLDSTQWWTQTLPTSDDGKIYIYIGDAYDWYRLTFTEDKPVYWYKNGKLQLFSGASTYSLSSASANSIAWGNITEKPNRAGSSSDGGAANSLANFQVSTTTSLGLETTTNSIGYASSLTKADWNFQQPDGAIYTQFYNASWKHQIFGDYRTGQISIRGKNNGTWQNWRRVLDETNAATILNLGAWAYKSSGTGSDVGLGNVTNDAQVKKAGDTMTGILTIRLTNDQPSLQVVDGQYNNNDFRLSLVITHSSGVHGLWSSGYLNGSTFTSSGDYLIYRDSSGTITVNGNCTGSATSATKDSAGNTIKDTYLKLSGGTLTNSLYLKYSLPPSINFSCNTYTSGNNSYVTTDNWASFTYYPPAKNTSNNTYSGGHFAFGERSYSDGPAANSALEFYHLPAVTKGLSSNVIYNIFTSKGVSLGSITSLNSLKLFGNGFYNAGSVSGLPSTTSGAYFTVFCWDTIQLALNSSSSGATKFYVRYYNSGWKAWTSVTLS